ncbi:MAG TPA: ABC transporter permease [Myxococcota bacterium]|nr:ABC transporter permease [Myxococcota bacterium]
MRALGSVVAKDLRLLVRDRAGLVFLAVAPIVVITVAGLSLSTLYGAEPSGQTAYDLPVADEDGSAASREIVERLGAAPDLRVAVVADRAAAEALVRDAKRAGTALVIPAGTDAALREGRTAELLLVTDPVKYLERVHVQLALGRVRDAMLEARGEEARRDADDGIASLRAQLEDARASLTAAQQELASAAQEAQRRRAVAEARLQRDEDHAREALRARLTTELDAAGARAEQQVSQQVESVREPLARWLSALGASRDAFAQWLHELEQLAGARADRIPPPPSFPEPPPELTRFLDRGVALDVARPEVPELPPLPRIELPPLPEPPALALPALSLPELPSAPGSLRLVERGISGASSTVNTFDQNVPGFSVTFLLLGMLLGVSLGLLDERDWGTFDRLRSLPIGLATVLTGKLLSRFCVGVAQMIVLFAVGRAAFAISLGPQPLALLLPITGIAFAGAAFGLLVAAVAPSRDSVLPVGSAVAITMAAIGGCWWPIDLEPRWIRQVALWLPTRWAMEAFNDLMMRQRTVSAALVPTAVLLAFGLAFLVAGLALFRRRLATPPTS